MTPNRNTHWRRDSRHRRRYGRGGLSEVGEVAVSGNSKFLLDDTLPTNERSGTPWARSINNVKEPPGERG